MKRKYIVHIVATGFVGVLMIYASTCNPLLPEQITQIVQQNINPACYIQSYRVELPELPQSYNLDQVNSNAVYGTPASGVSTTAVPFTGVTKLG